MKVFIYTYLKIIYALYFYVLHFIIYVVTL